MRIRVVPFLLLAAVTGTSAACGAPTTESVLTPLPGPTVAPRSSTATVAPVRDSPQTITTLSLWLPEELDPYGEGPGAPILAKHLSDFSRAYPNLRADVVVKRGRGRGGLLDFLRTAREAAPNVLPDLVVLSTGDIEGVAASGLIQPLDETLSPSKADDRFPFAVTVGSHEGHIVGFPIAADLQLLAYRNQLLATPPVSWTGVLSPPLPFVFPAAALNGSVNDATLIQYLAAGGDFMDDEGKPGLDKAPMLSVLEFYSKCVSLGAVSPTLVLGTPSGNQTWERFQAGESGIAAVPAGRLFLERDEMTAVGPLPTRDGRPLSIARGWALAMVTREASRQRLTALLLDWLTAPDHNAPWTRAAGLVPCTRSSLLLWDVSESDRAILRTLLEASVPEPRADVLAEVGPAMQEALESVIALRQQPETAVSTAIASIES
jgi:ABC-type glycerol-3-phosphate transport system substrate-binding protein